MNNVNELHEAMARVVVADRQLAGVLNEITGITRRAMPSIEAASVTLIRGETAVHGCIRRADGSGRRQAAVRARVRTLC
jgi:hypothetical protein